MAQAEPTYEELRALRAKEWASAQARASVNLAEVNAQIAKMPDVVNAPAPDQLWSHRGILCAACEGNEFYVTRYVTVNGVKHRSELECFNCKVVGTWDWTEKIWLT